MFSGHRIKQQSKLAAQIRLSYLILLLPNLVFMIYALYNLFLVSERYNTMLNSVVTASEFSLDFKEDFHTFHVRRFRMSFLVFFEHLASFFVVSVLAKLAHLVKNSFVLRVRHKIREWPFSSERQKLEEK